MFVSLRENYFLSPEEYNLKIKRLAKVRFEPFFSPVGEMSGKFQES